MLCHFVALMWMKLVQGEPGEIAWISHATLLLAGVAMMLRSSRLCAVAFVNVAGVHSLWIFDAIVGTSTGKFPVGVTNYVATCDVPTFAATLHHAYLAPVLLWWLVARGHLDRSDWWRALVGGIATMTFLCLVSRLLLPSAINANVAHSLFAESTSSAFRWYNKLPWWNYLAIHIPVWSAVFILPGSIVLLLLGKKAGYLSEGLRRGRAAC